MTPIEAPPAIEKGKKNGNVETALADELLRQKLKVSTNVAGYRTAIGDVLTQVKGINGAERRVQTVAKAMDDHGMAEQYGDVKIAGNLGEGVGGMNNGLSKDTVIADDKLAPEALVANPEESAEILDHERNVDRGHAGQSKDVRDVIDADGQKKDVEVQLEGEVESNQSEKWRGGEARDNQPEETYGEGQRFIEGVGLDKARQYIRKGGQREGDAAWFQAEILKKSAMTPEQMQTSLQRQTSFNHEEIQRIVQDARPGEKEKMPEVEYAVAV